MSYFFSFSQTYREHSSLLSTAKICQDSTPLEVEYFAHFVVVFFGSCKAVLVFRRTCKLFLNFATNNLKIISMLDN